MIDASSLVIPANLAAQLGSSPADMGRATSLAMFFRGFGGAVSSAVVGTMCAAGGPGAPGAMASAAAVAALGAAASVLLPRKVDRRR